MVVATLGGISVISASGDIKNYTYLDGLPGVDALELTSDGINLVWIRSQHGIGVLDLSAVVGVDLDELAEYRRGR